MGAYVESASDKFDYDNDWQEKVGDAGPGQTELTNDAQEAMLQGWIPWNKQRSAARFFLGFAYADTIAPWRLHRENPSAHPVMPWLFAHSISFEPYGPKGNPDNLDGDNNKYVNIDSPFNNLWSTPINLRTGYYEKVLATVRYRSFRCTFLDDDAIASTEEWKRSVFVDAMPRVEALSADGIANLYYSETSAGGPSLGPPPAPFPVPAAIIQAKTGFVIHWLNVPLPFLSSEILIFYPDKILNCVGKVHSGSNFLDTFPTDTIFMEPPTFNVKPAPVASDRPTFPLFYVDVTMPISYFNPTLGAAVPVLRGWQAFPWRLNGKYYGCKRGDTNTPYLEYADFNTVFSSVNAP